MGRLFGAGNKASAKGGKRTGGFTKNSAKTAKKLQTRQTLMQTVQHEVDSGNSLTEAEISAIVDADAGIFFGDVEVWPGDEEDQMPELMSQSSDDDWYQKVIGRRLTPREAEISAIVEAELARLEAGSSSDEDDERYWYRDEDNEAPPTKLRKRRKLHDSASASHDGAAEDTRSRIVQVLPAIAGEEEYWTLRADGISRVETAEALELAGELPHVWTAWGAPRYCAGKN